MEYTVSSCIIKISVHILYLLKAVTLSTSLIYLVASCEDSKDTLKWTESLDFTFIQVPIRQDIFYLWGGNKWTYLACLNVWYSNDSVRNISMLFHLWWQLLPLFILLNSEGSYFMFILALPPLCFPCLRTALRECIVQYSGTRTPVMFAWHCVSLRYTLYDVSFHHF